ncbi:MAG: hypothetical protein JKY93_12345 [Gammaproteobacteria bacterium]|nr:hypothetical protein [Gammaproteobacteria bacterium]
MNKLRAISMMAAVITGVLSPAFAQTTISKNTDKEFSVLTGVLSPASGQTTISKNADKRFSGILKSNVYQNTDPAGLMESYQLSLEWWMLLGQATEFYALKWKSTEKYSVAYRGKSYTVRRGNLANYPDLLKRFDNLQPSKLDLEIYGDATGHVFQLDRKKSQLNPDFFSTLGFRKQRGNRIGRKTIVFAKYKMKAAVKYPVPDHKLLYSRAGASGADLLPRSPLNWNAFLRWQTPGGYVLNEEGQKFRQLSSTQKLTLEKRLKQLFERANDLSLSVRVKRLEWPVVEMATIGQLLKEYDFGKKTPPPSRKVAEGMKEVEGLSAYSARDEWAQAEVIKADGFEIKSRNGKNGVVAKNGQILIPFRDWEVLSYKSLYAHVRKTKNHSEKSGSCTVLDRTFSPSFSFTESETGWVNARGEWVQTPRNSVRYEAPYSQKNFQLILRRVEDDRHLSAAERANKEARAKASRARARRKAARKKKDVAVCGRKKSAIIDNILNKYRSRGFDIE